MKKKSFILLLGIIFCLTTLMPKIIFAIDEEEVKAMLNTLNHQLIIAGENFQIEKVEFQTVDEVGPVVFANNRTHQLTSHFVPFDPRRLSGSAITWLTDQVDGSSNGASLVETQAAVARAMNTWGTVPCANIPLVQLSDNGEDWGYVQWLVGMGGSPFIPADLTHAGWLPGTFFEIIGGPGGSQFILGATFTFTFRDPITDIPTDIDNNGKRDVFFREIYYNNNFPWGIDTQEDIDIESVVLHEAGHGLSLGHFGKIFITQNGKLHFTPKAVMNAIYFDIKHDLFGTDNASFCSLWAPWPNK